MKPFYVYMLRCADGTFYVGHTDELERCVALHQSGQVQGCTSERRPVELVWSQEAATRLEALSAERQIKGWSRAKQLALVQGDRDSLRQLARSGGGEFDGAAVGGAGASTGRTDEKDAGETPPGAPPPDAPPTPVRLELAEGPAHPAPVDGSQAHPPADRDPLLQALLAPPGPGQRRAIAKAITLLESARPADRPRAEALLDALLPHAGRSFRLGLSGVPGVGKSTFIETLGLQLIEQGHRVAVLAIDPSSTVSGGSILGDKTRMQRLSVHEQAFIRPSPSAGTLGGVAEKTRESIAVFEAAGYDFLIIETVGVGQNEVAVAGMTDFFVLMHLPNAGDDLQALKKGVTERADLVVINKADLDEDAATRARAQITSALRLLHHPARADQAAPWQPRVIQLSALHGGGLDGFHASLAEFRRQQQASGRFAARRRQQNEAWLWERIQAGLMQRFRDHAAVRALWPGLAARVRDGALPASVAARRLLDALDRQSPAFRSEEP